LGAVRRAADAGWEILTAGGTALAAVEAATRVLEDDPLFDAGVGSYLNRDGEVEVDAIIVDGHDLSFGAVAAVKRVRNPITLARLVLTESPHAMLAGPGAERFARERGLTVPSMDLVTAETLRLWRARRSADQGGDLGDTVGAVATDGAGHVAAATSTGGTRFKWPGRVGDSPIIGSGAYADDRAGAVSCTGPGESIMRVCLAYAACAEMAAGASAPAACQRALDTLTERTGSPAGLIAIDHHGRPGWARTTAAMPYAWRDEGGAGEGL